MLKIGLLGSQGRMGAYIAQESARDKAFHLVGGLVREKSSSSVSSSLCPFVTDDPHDLFPKVDVLIDFTTPGSTQRHLEWAQHYERPLVIGTTGLSEEDQLKIQTYGTSLPLFQSYNMSMVHAVMAQMVESLAQILDASYDIEIFEMHHAKKRDAPSGSALNLGQAAAKGRGFSLKMPLDLNRVARRQEGTIGFAVSRGGNVAGDHHVTFAGQNDLLTVTHRAFSPRVFAQGALKAAEWLRDQKPGVYTMNDLLGKGKGFHLGKD